MTLPTRLGAQFQMHAAVRSKSIWLIEKSEGRFGFTEDFCIPVLHFSNLFGVVNVGGKPIVAKVRRRRRAKQTAGTQSPPAPTSLVVMMPAVYTRRSE
jgi:hypothetical protein